VKPCDQRMFGRILRKLTAATIGRGRDADSQRLPVTWRIQVSVPIVLERGEVEAL